jgi:thioredoxin
MSVIELSDDSVFMDKMSEAGSRLVVVDFFATWCGPCNQIAPFYKQLATKNPNVMFLKVDVDKCPGTAAANNVSAMPTFIFFRNRSELERLRGADKSALESKVKQHSESSAQTGEGGSEEKPAVNGDYVSLKHT